MEDTGAREQTTTIADFIVTSLYGHVIKGRLLLISACKHTNHRYTLVHFDAHLFVLQKAYMSTRGHEPPEVLSGYGGRTASPLRVAATHPKASGDNSAIKATAVIPAEYLLSVCIACGFSWVEERTWHRAPTAAQPRKCTNDKASWGAPAPAKKPFKYYHCGKWNRYFHSPFGFVPTSRRWKTHWQLSQVNQKKKKQNSGEWEKGGGGFS